MRNIEKNTKVGIILSLGQLTSYNVWDTIGGFANILSGNKPVISKIIYPFAYGYTCLVYCYDWLIAKNIERYKCGDINSVQFRQYLKGFFGNISDDKIDEAWNKGCKVNENNAFKNTLFDLLQQNPNLNLLVASVTNEINTQYIENNLSHNYVNWQKLCDEGRIQVAYSFKHNENKPQNMSMLYLANTMIANREYTIISLHNQVQDPQSIGVDSSKFSYIPLYSNASISKPEADIKVILGKITPKSTGEYSINI